MLASTHVKKENWQWWSLIKNFLSGTGLATSASSHALGESSPPISPITMSHTTPSLYPTMNPSHNSNYQPTTLGYLPSTNYNVPISQQYNSLGHNYSSNKTNFGNLGSLGQQIGHQSVAWNLGTTGNVHGWAKSGTYKIFAKDVLDVGNIFWKRKTFFEAENIFSKQKTIFVNIKHFLKTFFLSRC